MVLLVVDTQNAIMNDNLYNFNILKENIEKLISAARGNNIEVIFIRHDDGKESE
ncbi:MAG: isochorismatase family protein, partial [Clostridia bacterium]|nr:isochorismatase family protein [Clostridia bacterium]